LDKDAILAFYLSHAPYGGNLEGIRATAIAWFGKEPARLNPAEAALLIALPQSPCPNRPAPIALTQSP
jgi:penicillin-binding protein 1C